MGEIIEAPLRDIRGGDVIDDFAAALAGEVGSDREGRQQWRGGRALATKPGCCLWTSPPAGCDNPLVPLV